MLLYDIYIHLQWNLSNTDTLWTKIIVPISEVSFFQGENKVGTQSRVLINQGVLFSEVSFKRGFTVVLFVTHYDIHQHVDFCVPSIQSHIN